MDNSTDFFINPLQTDHFISVVSAITILSNIFYSENLLTENDQMKPIPIVNSLCEYLHRNNSNIENVTITIGKKLLNNTEFYGSRENETIHIDYVNAMINHIIASLVFSNFGNTFGYLGAIVNRTNNLTLPFVKMKIKKDLNAREFLNPDYTISKLNQFVIERITEKLIFPLFPEKEILRIIDADYMYAQAGLMFARSAKISNTSFEECITIAQSIEQGVRFGELDNSALRIFQLPAILYYAYKKSEEFGNATFHILVHEANFWNSSFNSLFMDLDVERKKIDEIEKNNPVNNFQKALFAYRNRTEYAEHLIRRMCPLLNESDYEEEVKKYKYNNADYYCKGDNFHMPDINDLFTIQNEFVANLYSYVEKSLLREEFNNDLINYIKQPNTTISSMEILHRHGGCFRCKHFREKINPNTILFQINPNSENPLTYALVNRNNNITLHSTENRDLFMETIGLSSSTKLIPNNRKPLKLFYQTFDKFLANMVEPKRIEFFNLLQNMNYEPTTGESVVEFLKNFIPFYNCFRAAQTETVVRAVCTCLVESLVLIPLFGQAANMGLKFASAGVKPLLMNFQNSMISFSIGQFVTVTLKTGLLNLASQSAKAISSLITKDLFKKIGISVIRTLDPGIELSYTLGKAGIRSLTKCFGLIGRKVSSLTKVIKSLTFREPLKVGHFKGNDLYCGSITGKDGYGIRYMNLNDKTVELRRLHGYKTEMPVVLISDPNSQRRIYRIIDPTTGELKTTNWEMNAENVLQVETQPLAVRLKTIQVEGLSGRGRLINPRIRNKQHVIETQNQFITEWRDRIDDVKIRYILQNYVLEDDAFKIQVFNHIAESNTIPGWIKPYKLRNVQDYVNLRYNSYVEDILLTSDEAMDRINLMYKNQYRSEVSNIRPDIMYDFYCAHRLHSVVNFEDFYSIGTLSHDSRRILVENPESWIIQNAFNRLALRFVDFPTFDAPLTLYRFEHGTTHIVNTHMTGHNFKIKTLTSLGKNLEDCLQNTESFVFDGGKVNVLYEIIIDYPYMVVDVDAIIPGMKWPVLLLPGTEFVIDNAAYQMINEKLVYKVTMKNTLITKSKWIVNLNKNINILNERILKHNEVLDDFDLGLLN